MRKFLLALIALVCFSVPAVAQECQPVDQVMAQFESIGGTNPEFLEGRAKSIALQFFESELPAPVEDLPKELVAQLIVFLGDLPDGSGALAAGIQGGGMPAMLCVKKIIPKEHFQRVKVIILGQPTI
jgi:hypothetical protein